MTYYRILADNERYPDRWFLDEPRDKHGVEIDSREFCYGKPYVGPLPTQVPVYQAGKPIAFHFAAFEMPVVTNEIGRLLSNICRDDIERFSVTVGSDITGYEIVNVLAEEDCVDELRARARKWTPDSARPDLSGQYMEISSLLIDPTRTNGRNIFRIWGYNVALIASEAVKEAIEELPCLGVVFKRVS